MLAVELDPVWSGQLRQRVRDAGMADRVRVVRGDLRTVPLPEDRWRVIANPPYGLTTTALRRLLDDPARAPEQVDLVLQWEVARKRAAVGGTTLLTASWWPWYEFDLAGRVFAGVPAPTNLAVPPYRYINEGTILIGADTAGSA